MNTHCYLKGVTMLESIESLVGESFFLSVIRNIVATRQWFDLDVFAEYFTDVIIENTQLKEVRKFTIKKNITSYCFFQIYTEDRH